MAAGTRAHRVRPVDRGRARRGPARQHGAPRVHGRHRGRADDTLRRDPGRSRAHLLPSADSLAAPIRRLVALLEDGAAPAGHRANPRRHAARAGRRFAARGRHPPRRWCRTARCIGCRSTPCGCRTAAPAVERWAIGLAPSAGVALGLWRDDRATAVGDTRGPSGDRAIPSSPASRSRSRVATRRSIRSAFAAEGGLARLTGSGEEARAVARYAAGAAEVRLRSDASERWLKARAARRLPRHPPRHPRAGGRDLPGPHRARARAG